MHILKDEVLFPVKHLCLLDCLLAPQHKHDSARFFVNGLDYRVAELLPALLLVAVGDAFSYCKDCVEQEHALGCPSRKIAVEGLRHFKVHSGIVIQSMVDLLQTWWAFCSFGYAERQSHSFVLFYVGILANDHYFQITELSFRKGIEDEMFWRETNTGRVLFYNILVERAV